MRNWFIIVFSYFYHRKIVYNINLPKNNKKQFLNNLQDNLIIEINKNGTSDTNDEKFMPIIILKFDKLENFCIYKIIEKYDIDNRYQNLEFIVNNGKV